MNFISKNTKKKKMIALITLALVATMTLSSFVSAENTNDDTSSQINAEQQQEQKEKIKSERDGKRFIKPRLYFHNREALKSVLNLTDDELKSKLAESGNDIYKLLESYGKVEEYKTAVLSLTKEKLNQAVADSKITQEKADAMYAKAEAAMQEFGVASEDSTAETKSNSSRTFQFGIDSSDIETWRQSFDIDLDELREKMGKAREVFEDFAEAGSSDSIGNSAHDRKIWFGLNESSLCEILGISEEELKTKLVENNGNIYKILEEAGKIEEYKAEILKTAREALDKAVSENKITQEYADAMYARSEEVMNNFVISGDDTVMFTRPDNSEGVFEYFKSRDKNKDSAEVGHKEQDEANDSNTSTISPANTNSTNTGTQIQDKDI